MSLEDTSKMALGIQLTSFDLLRLNDDCIIAILRQLSLDDLSSAASSCGRMRRLARQVFVLDKTNERYHINCMTDVYGGQQNDYRSIDYDEFDGMRSQQPYNTELLVKQYLANFGDLLREVDLDYLFELTFGCDLNVYYSNRTVFSDLVQHCSGTLKRLTLRKFTWTSELLEQARHLLTQLTKFQSLNGKNTEWILPVLKNCVDLSIIEEHNIHIQLQSDFTKLERFSLLVYDGNNQNKKNIQEFLQRHKNLRHLELNAYADIDLSAICEMQHLKELNISNRGKRFTFSQNIPSNFQFCRLEKCTLSSEGDALSSVLLRLADSPAVATLKYLKTSGAYLSVDAVAALSRFDQLEEFVIHYDGNVDLKHNRRLGHMQRLKRLTIHGEGTHNYQLPSMPLLEVVDLVLSWMHLDLNLINQLVRMPQLSNLTLSRCRIENIRSSADAAERNAALGNINRLQKLTLKDFHDDDAADGAYILLYNLGSTSTLLTLELHDSTIRTDDLRSICRYQNLRKLQILDSSIDGYFKKSRKQLRLMRSIKYMDLRVEINNLSTLLRTLGCADALETLYITDTKILVVSDICRYRNLRELRICVHKARWIEQYQALSSLKHFRKWTIRQMIKPITSLEMDDVEWRGLVELLCRLESITFLQLFSFGIRNFIHELYAELLQTCRRQSRRLLIELHDRSNLDLPSFMFENDNCRYVDIKHVFLNDDDWH